MLIRFDSTRLGSAQANSIRLESDLKPQKCSLEINCSKFYAELKTNTCCL